jgi:hypothetical protein
MSDLRSFAALQAKVFEFLGQQDEATLQAIVDGERQLAVLDVDGTREAAAPAPREAISVATPPASTGLTMTPSDDPLQAAQDLTKLTSEQDRRTYLNAAGFNKDGLLEVARLRKLARFSKLRKDELLDRLAQQGRSTQPEAPADEPRTPATPPPAATADDVAKAVRPATTPAAQPAPPTPPAATIEPNADVAAVTSRLSEIETEAEGATYLKAQHLDRATLLAVAAELQLTRVERLTQSELQKKILRQAIGARRRFAGLRKW